MLKYILLQALAASAIASPLQTRQDSGQPSVTIQNGTLLGLDQPQFGQELFLGIPFADPPVRLARAEPLSTSYGQRQATEYGPLCWSRVPVATGFNDNSGFEESEDCLTLNVVRPYGVFEGQKQVPVVAWIHGGGLSNGGSADYRYNATAFVQASVTNGHPVVFVSMNYRVASLGFLASSQLKEANSLNLGYLDQRLALQWIQANIAKFGGDPKQVTIMGESAGGTSVYGHMLAYGGRNDGLFHQAIIESSGGFNRYPAPDAPAYQATYDSLIANTTCSSVADSSVEDQLECLRGLDIGTYRNVSTGTTGVVRDDTFVQGGGPVGAFRDGRWVKVPVLVGSNTDEGVSFFTPGANTTEQRRANLQTINDTDIEAILSLYPDDPKLGCPFYTGDYQLDPFQNGGYLRPGRFNKQVAAITGDQRQQAGPRWLAETISKEVPVYKFLFNHIPWTVSFGVADYVGHFVEVSYVFNLQNNNTEFWERNHFTATYLGPGAPNDDRALGDYMSRAWTSFIATGDPNNANFSAAVKWPKYSESAPQQIVWRVKGSTIETDNAREEGIRYMIDNIIKPSS